MDLITQREIEQAKNVLRKFGYAVDNLWHISEIKAQYNCTDEEAFKVLNGALKNDAIIGEIRFAIGMEAESENLEEIEEKEEKE